jgi:hypothetical protein
MPETVQVIVAQAVYILCALTASVCAFLLIRASRKSPSRFLLFSGFCFACLAVNSILLVLDRIVFPVEIDLRVWRISAASVGLAVLLWALITQKES